MLMIPGVVISVLTFPGVIFHEFAHLFFCKMRGLAVYDVKYFVLDTKVQGYVIHEKPTDFRTALLISVGPLIINTLLCLVICMPAVTPIRFFDEHSFISYLLIWLGVSIGMHAFPSIGDAENIWEMAKVEARKKNLLAILCFPFVVLIIIANALRVIWFDAIYGFLIGIVLSGRLLGLILAAL